MDTEEKVGVGCRGGVFSVAEIYEMAERLNTHHPLLITPQTYRRAKTLFSMEDNDAPLAEKLELVASEDRIAPKSVENGFRAMIRTYQGIQWDCDEKKEPEAPSKAPSPGMNLAVSIVMSAAKVLGRIEAAEKTGREVRTEYLNRLTDAALLLGDLSDEEG